jgi:hypothetical protein
MHISCVHNTLVNRVALLVRVIFYRLRKHDRLKAVPRPLLLCDILFSSMCGRAEHLNIIFLHLAVQHQSSHRQPRELHRWLLHVRTKTRVNERQFTANSLLDTEAMQSDVVAQAGKPRLKHECLRERTCTGTTRKF